MGTKTKNNINEIIKLTKKIDGWLSIQEGYFLYRLANNLPPKAIVVEIGSWKGKSTIWLGKGFRKIKDARIFSVDPHFGELKNKRKIDTFSEFKKNISHSGLQGKVNIIKKTSAEAGQEFNKKIDLLFIDGSHEYADVQKDFSLWSEKLNPDAWVIVHDATILPGPWKVSRNNILLSSRFENTGMLGSMVFGRFSNPSKISLKAKNFSRNLLICLFTSIYAKMRRINLPRSWRNKIRKLNFNWRITQLKNV